MSKRRSAGRAQVAATIISPAAFLLGIIWLVGIFVSFPQGQYVDGVLVHVRGDY